MRYCGTTAILGFDDVIIQGSTDPKDPKFSAFYVKNNDVIAVLGMQTDPTVSLSAELLYGKTVWLIKPLIEQRDGFRLWTLSDLEWTSGKWIC